MMQKLLPLDKAAAELGVPTASLKTAAEKHGMLVRMGRALRIDPATIPELIARCQEKPQAPASTNARTTVSSSSATPVSPTSAQALATAERLKRRSPPTSPERGSSQAVVIPLK